MNKERKDLTKEIMDVVEKYGFEYMPTSMDLRKVEKTRLDSMISKNGGYVYWRKRLCLKPKVARIKLSSNG